MLSGHHSSAINYWVKQGDFSDILSTLSWGRNEA